MEQTQFLYGASVQGIQSFIFKTNKLKEIIESSELVDTICGTLFDSFCKKHNINKATIIQAAGNIKVIVENSKQCEELVKYFPREMQIAAPGITISQAVVAYDKMRYKELITELEDKLRQERNRPCRPLNIGFSTFERDRSTGLPATRRTNEGWLDARRSILNENNSKNKTNYQLYERCFDEKFNHENMSYYFDDISSNKSWIAVIHADGNGLGQLVQSIGENREKLTEFSEKLNEINSKAAIKAYNEMLIKFPNLSFAEKKPIRPIVLAGDDFTVVCKGDIAIDYTQEFIKAFEELSKKELQQQLCAAKMEKITFCAGIAFIKDSFPFYYGYNLAEELCTQAKKDSKSLVEKQYLAESCIMFHKVQSSFVEDYNEIIDKELTNKKGDYVFGPYYINRTEDRETVDSLLYNTETLLKNNDNNKIKSHIRQWMTIITENSGQADQKIERVKSLLENETCKRIFKTATEEVERNNKIHYRAYDLLAIASIKSTK